MAEYFTTTLGDAYERLVEDRQFLQVTLVRTTSSSSKKGTWLTDDHKIEIKDADPGERFGYQVVIFADDDCIISSDVEELVRVYDSKIEICSCGDTIEPMELSVVSGLKKKVMAKK